MTFVGSREDAVCAPAIALGSDRKATAFCGILKQFDLDKKCFETDSREEHTLDGLPKKRTPTRAPVGEREGRARHVTGHVGFPVGPIREARLRTREQLANGVGRLLFDARLFEANRPSQHCQFQSPGSPRRRVPQKRKNRGYTWRQQPKHKTATSGRVRRSKQARGKYSPTGGLLRAFAAFAHAAVRFHRSYPQNPLDCAGIASFNPQVCKGHTISVTTGENERGPGPKITNAKVQETTSCKQSGRLENRRDELRAFSAIPQGMGVCCRCEKLSPSPLLDA